MGLEEKIINIIKSLYRNSKAEFNLENITVEVESNRGLRQGCTLSPLLFILFMEEFIRRIKKLNLGIKIGEEKLGTLLFADDIILLAESKEDLDKMLKEVEKFSMEMSINFSPEKAKL